MIDSERGPDTKATGAPVPKSGELAARVASSAVLAPLALVIAYVGGLVFLAFWAAAAVAVHVEWSRMIAGKAVRARIIVGAAILVVAALALPAVSIAAGIMVRFSTAWAVAAALAIIAAGMALMAAMTPERRGMAALGLAYAGVLVVAPWLLRVDREFGWPALAFLFAVVWATDIGGYFAGRLIGGAKLWPRVSPKKTWAGALGGAAGAVVAAIGLGVGMVASNPLALAGLALLLSAVSQAGDLFESAIKRRYGIKDAGQIIPGHGGVMDRLDGFLTAILLAAIFGAVRGGADAAGSGLFLW